MNFDEFLCDQSDILMGLLIMETGVTQKKVQLSLMYRHFNITEVSKWLSYLS